MDRTVSQVDWITPGTKSGLNELDNFIQKRLKIFGDKRNDPNVAALSNLSPWLHFGMKFQKLFIIIINFAMIQKDKYLHSAVFSK